MQKNLFFFPRKKENHAGKGKKPIAFPKEKKGQMKLSFGMIFSIILIAVFVAFAFYAIQKLIGFQDQINVVQFKDDLQKDIDKLWKSPLGSQEVSYRVPQGVEKVCLIDYDSLPEGRDLDIYDKLKQVYYETENVFFYPIGKTEGNNAFRLKHLDLEKTTDENNPLCFKTEDSKIKMIINMKYGESLVCIGAHCEEQ
jgi:hypothetical protein